MTGFTQSSFQTAVALFYKAWGLDVFGVHKWLLKTLSWSPQQRQDWRLHRLNDILEFAWDHVSFYREYWGDHGVKFGKLKAIEELQRYPVLTKDIFRANSNRIRPDNLSSIRHRKWHTGGTTGQPVHYLRDLEQWILAEAFHLWGWSQLGYVFGDPVGVIAGGSLIPEKRKLEARVRGWMHRRLFLYGVAMDRSIAREYCDRLRKHGAKYLYGYPSALYLFGKHLAEQGLSLPGLKAVVTTAEMLQPRYREGIESTLACRVFNNLGCNDGGFESYECNQHNGLHYNDLQSILEVDSPSSGSEGRLLITNLWNKSTPFIRYENGDIVTMETEPCVCGCPFPLIGAIQGRTADILTFANGRSLAGPALTLIFGAMEIDGWQVVQTGPNRLEVRMCSTSEISPEDRHHIRNILRYYLDDEVEVVINRVEKLETTKGGKLKPIWIEEGDSPIGIVN
jgi:phenylacetate-CoA ligase